jgi:hypothetical protein
MQLNLVMVWLSEDARRIKKDNLFYTGQNFICPSLRGALATKQSTVLVIAVKVTFSSANYVTLTAMTEEGDSFTIDSSSFSV